MAEKGQCIHIIVLGLEYLPNISFNIEKKIESTTNDSLTNFNGLSQIFYFLFLKINWAFMKSLCWPPGSPQVMIKFYRKMIHCAKQSPESIQSKRTPLKPSLMVKIQHPKPSCLTHFGCNHHTPNPTADLTPNFFIQLKNKPT